ncbi:hypothetical protein ACWDO6_34170 [Streptomyces sp. NPDC003674]
MSRKAIPLLSPFRLRSSETVKKGQGFSADGNSLKLGMRQLPDAADQVRVGPILRGRTAGLSAASTPAAVAEYVPVIRFTRYNTAQE